MRISRVQIRNFRNFAKLDVALGEHAVIVGENKIGKSNLLQALRLVLDPSLPDSARKLREEDFWDGLQRPLGKDDRIVISVELTRFEENEHQLAGLPKHLTSEYRVKTEGRGRTVDEWKLCVDGLDNHWLDCLVGCAVAASIQGAVLFGTDAKPMLRPRIRLSELQGVRR